MAGGMRGRLLIFGLGYAGAAVARAAVAAGFAVAATRRRPDAADPPPAGVTPIPFDAASLAGITHVLSTVPPGPDDPVLARHGAAIAACASLRWVGYLSSTAVYGDRGGAWVDEASEPAPGSARARERLAAEGGWAALAGRVAVDLFRVAVIYGPGRSALDRLRAGDAVRVIRPGHVFSRIHVDDLAGAVLAAIRTAGAGQRVLHLADDLPAEPTALLDEAAALLGLPPPPALPFDEAPMSPAAAAFWAEHRRVASARTQQALGYRWRYPDYRAGLRAIAEQFGDARGEQREIGRA